VLGNDLPPIIITDDEPDDVFFLEKNLRKAGAKNRFWIFHDGDEFSAHAA